MRGRSNSNHSTSNYLICTRNILVRWFCSDTTPAQNLATRGMMLVMNIPPQPSIVHAIIARLFPAVVASVYQEGYNDGYNDGLQDEDEPLELAHREAISAALAAFPENLKPLFSELAEQRDNIRGDY